MRYAPERVDRRRPFINFARTQAPCGSVGLWVVFRQRSLAAAGFAIKGCSPCENDRDSSPDRRTQLSPASVLVRTDGGPRARGECARRSPTHPRPPAPSCALESLPISSSTHICIYTLLLSRRNVSGGTPACFVLTSLSCFDFGCGCFLSIGAM